LAARVAHGRLKCFSGLFPILFIRVEADAALRRDGLGKEKLVDGFDDRGYLLALLLLPAADLLDRVRQVFVRGEDLAEPHEGAHDENVHAHCPIAFENRLEHGNAEFGEGVRASAEPHLGGGIGHHNL
jgi:hypothetical protein